MIQYGHYIGGKHVAGDLRSHRRRISADGRNGARRVALASPAEVRAAVENAKAAQPAWAATNPQRRARVLMKFNDLIAQHDRRTRRHSRPRARQDDHRRQGRHPARRRGARIRVRRAAYDEGRIYRRRRPRHRHLFDAPAARRRRRHHAVQLPGDDPAVEARAGDRLRQRLHPQALRARPRRADAARRIVRRGRRPARHPQRRQRRQGRGRRDPRRSRHQGDRLRRLDADRRIYLCARNGDRQTRAVLRRRQEPYGRHARRRHGSGGRRADRRRLRRGGRALHGDLGRGAGRPEDGRRTGQAADPARREPEGRTLDRFERRLRPAGDAAPISTRSRATSISASRKAPSSRSTAAASSMQGYENGFYSAAACSTT